MMGRASITMCLLATVCCTTAVAEPGRGFPFRGASSHCVGADSAPRHAKGDFRWFPSALAYARGREDGCRVERLTRYGQAQAWHVKLSCPEGLAHEDWMLNYDGSITANRDGTKTTFRPCERPASH